MTGQPLDSIPIWAVYLLTVLLFLAAVELGYRITKANQRKPATEGDSGIGELAAATLALLAFLLAFVVAFASDISSERRQLVIKEANAIRTAYL